MEREIKFRAWDNKTVRYDVTGLEHYKDNEMGGVFLDGDYYSLVDNNNGNGLAVLMQYTGLKDKNGKEIYEGDLYHAGDTNIIYQVIFNKGCFIGNQIGNRSLAGLSDFIYSIEIIGNIHQNPELLK